MRFRANDPSGTRYWLQETITFAGPDSLRLRTAAGLRNPPGGADVVIATSGVLRSAAERLAGWHQANGRRALVVELQDVYDEFNAGILHPKAVPAMLTWAADHWAPPAPTYLTLLGDGDWNFKGYNPARYPPGPNHVPPYLAWVDPWQGEVPADAFYGDLDGDSVPEIAVGRLAVNTLAEADGVVDKIINYDQTTRREEWQRRALFVADNPDSASDFLAASDEIIANYIPADLSVLRAYLPTNATTEQIAPTRATISETLQTGIWMVQFTGHGAPGQWTHESIWRHNYVPGPTNGGMLPVVMTFDCLDGYFAHTDPGLVSIAETMQRHAAGGSIAAISPAGLGITSDQQEFRKILMHVMFKDNVRELGRALTITKRQYAQVFGINYLVPTVTLFGDSALRLPGPKPKTVYLPLIAR
ncbi:MAG: C25 family cysteine peptidase [Anaerolineae bacterium]